MSNTNEQPIQLCTVAQLAALTGHSVAAVRQAIDDIGLPPSAECNCIDLWDAECAGMIADFINDPGDKDH